MEALIKQMPIKIIHIALLILATAYLYAEEGIFGVWVDKNEPSSYKFEFARNNDFIYTHTSTHEGKDKSIKIIGSWELGTWSVMSSTKGDKGTCYIKIYADSAECCFDAKPITDNMVLTSLYTGGYSGSMCSNRVLVREK